MFTKIKGNFDGLRPELMKKDPVDSLKKAVELGLKVKLDLLQSAYECGAAKCSNYLEELLSA
ncbi:hypothetical protein TVAG_146500 [Trichomonas vaginalis G3]|uniref:Uncharacterized protein n=1 Tax=Trichomonas vaginalis (strain ATCC PRA-98 / G3) TaxID=412133 RepID=A2DKV4_TRIV3|nr:hypothetical protein TVAGG3_0361370 [Trichomonas vaginalis G3]EAY18907.1 hypothetical protein TVAG_146500 [Trichomonas vaginalis G3]KAI5531962.1 hypothetical protein TVAGG3_0361370 [Trichomonas vaginalis G3]|eukprot:XP_001579893.1 hypothetical protein [Trichomonas vaginalis G3]